MVQETFQTLLEKRSDPKVAQHPNIQAWLVVTLRNKIASELQRKWRHVEQPLAEDLSVAGPDCEPSFRDSLPRQLSEQEKDILCLFYELQLSHQEIGQLLGISDGASRMRLIRARNNYEKWKTYEESLQSTDVPKYKNKEVLGCPKRKECPQMAGRTL